MSPPAALSCLTCSSCLELGIPDNPFPGYFPRCCCCSCSKTAFPQRSRANNLCTEQWIGMRNNWLMFCCVWENVILSCSRLFKPAQKVLEAGVGGVWFLKFTCKRSFLLWRGFSFVFQGSLLYWEVLHRNEVVGKRFPLYIESHTENKTSEFKEPFHSQSCVSKAQVCVSSQGVCIKFMLQDNKKQSWKGLKAELKCRQQQGLREEQFRALVAAWGFKCSLKIDFTRQQKWEGEKYPR